jgi:hypothetical protein
MVETILSSAGFIVGLSLMIFGFISFKRYQRIRDTPTSKVRSVAVGTTELKGKVRKFDEENTHKHPINEDETVYYEITVQIKRDDQWDVIHNKYVGDKFILQDDTGKIEVRIEDNPAIDLEDAKEVTKYSMSPNEELPRALKGVTNKTQDDKLVPDFLESTEYRVTVKALYVDDFCYVLGDARPKDGSESSSTNEENIIIGHPNHRDNSSGSYIISNQREEELQKEEKWQGPISFIIGLILSAFCLFYFLQLFI